MACFAKLLWDGLLQLLQDFLQRQCTRRDKRECGRDEVGNAESVSSYTKIKEVGRPESEEKAVRRAKMRAFEIYSAGRTRWGYRRGHKATGARRTDRTVGEREVRRRAIDTVTCYDTSWHWDAATCLASTSSRGVGSPGMPTSLLFVVMFTREQASSAQPLCRKNSPDLSRYAASSMARSTPLSRSRTHLTGATPPASALAHPKSAQQRVPA